MPLASVPRPPRTGRAARARFFVLAGLLLIWTGCSTLFSGYDLAPSGMSRSDDSLRRLLERGEAQAALDRGAEAAPGDELLNALYHGILAHYGGDFVASDSALERAAELAEERYTKSVSRTALSLVSSDRALPFEPARTERLLIHYYGALNRLRRDDLAGAAVEARRLARLLERERNEEVHPRQLATIALLRTFTGAIFEAAGERNDAAVAYRNAAVLLGQSPDSISTPAPAPGMGSVIILVEEGFVAHRVEQSLILPLHPYEVHSLTRGTGDLRTSAAAAIAARILADALTETSVTLRERAKPRPLYISLPPDRYFIEECLRRESRHSNGDRRPDSADCESFSGSPYILRLAWPVHRLEAPPRNRNWVLESGATRTPVTRFADLSESVVHDLEEDRAWMLTRLIARSATKLALTRGIERGVSSHDEGLGQLLGFLANLGTAALEQADTRSWQLLPGRIGIVRIELPEGSHSLSLNARTGSSRPRLDLGTVQVEAGRTTFVSARVWR